MNRDLPTIALPDASGVLVPYSLLHLTELSRLADHAGLLRDLDLACTRMRHLLALHGVEA